MSIATVVLRKYLRRIVKRTPAGTNLDRLVVTGTGLEGRATLRRAHSMEQGVCSPIQYASVAPCLVFSRGDLLERTSAHGMRTALNVHFALKDELTDPILIIIFIIYLLGRSHQS